MFLSTGDFGGDGFLDIVAVDFGDPIFYKNMPNDNHWLRVELSGRPSNRQGLGARLVVTAGPLRQVRELLGGDGLTQNEPVAHFGLNLEIGQNANGDLIFSNRNNKNEVILLLYYNFVSLL